MTVRRYRLVHTTVLHYSSPVRASHNELRMTPLNEPGQTTLENRIRVRPMTWSHVYRDYWGSHVTSMEALDAHDQLDIEAISTVERASPEPPPDSPGWAALDDDRLRDRSYEWLTMTDRTRPGEGVHELAESVRGLATPREAAAAVAERIHGEMTYQTGVTQVHSSGEEAWSERRGVCQDFAHVTLGALRLMGIPARYVSGYLVPRGEDELGRPSIGESHAWVELWDGGWIAIDPTNLTPVDVDHVVVARGRDYTDVSPFKGVYHGAGAARLEVEVRFTRLT